VKGAADVPSDSLDGVELRVGAYAVVCDERGLLLAHWREGAYGGWTLPGGGLEPGEHPEQTVAREVHEETGYTVSVGALIGIESQVIAGERRVPGPGRTIQMLRILYRCTVVAGELRAERQGSTDDVGWFALDEIADLQHVQLVDDGLRMAGLAASKGTP
jgi:8-oxo-dGTP diphosphatase